MAKVGAGSNASEADQPFKLGHGIDAGEYVVRQNVLRNRSSKVLQDSPLSRCELVQLQRCQRHNAPGL
ncbi:hypothetical protein CTA1_3323 [Colletotrichum tanaceti]|uniref:Uncharacterized protein n=1 Tax=Colletotrichum tanaceti TaxID=1306861 RepID=A0A4U6XH70_9PEZI|nr:hypothetical protein CTA1_3323 [Colletotrichum tanaceti]